MSEDSRFSHINTDKRFKKLPRKQKKIKIDKRFQSMFHDKRFQLKSAVDKRGRPVSLASSKHLEKYYDLTDDSSSESEHENSADREQICEANDANNESKLDNVVSTDTESEANEAVIESFKSNGKCLSGEIKAKLKDLSVDYARGEAPLLSDSSSDEDSSSSEEEEKFDHDWGEFDKDAETTTEVTSRLALCNVDWDRITSQDLMVLFNSFLPPGGSLISVHIYPSDFGLKRMEEEEMKGPQELVSNTETEKEAEDEITSEQRENLRRYQLNRLRYYYAILEFDSPKTANHIYTECDGLEYESSMNRLDLRFVPEDTTFDQEPREKCCELPDLTTYKPRLFRTTALTQVKVDLTWDETDPSRQEMIRAVHSGACDDPRIGQLLASSSDEEVVGDDTRELVINEAAKDTTASEKGFMRKYKDLLVDIEKAETKKKDDISMEVVWDLKLEKKASEKVKETLTKTVKETPFEQFMKKKKEKMKGKKENRLQQINSQRSSGIENNVEEPFSDDDLPSDVDLNDEYFKQEIKTNRSNKTLRKNKKKELSSEKSTVDQQREAELDLLMLDEGNEDKKHHFSLKAIEESEKLAMKKGKSLKKRRLIKDKRPEDDFKIDVQDDRFSAIFSSHLYNVDPAEPHFHATPGMKALIAEKKRRLETGSEHADIKNSNDKK